MVFLSDVHFPYQDVGLVASAINLITALQPHRVVLNGDICDLFQISRFNTGLERLDSLQDEIDEANNFRALVRFAAPNAIIDETEGNHDSRMVSFVKQNARALSSLRALEPASLFKYRELDINWHPGAGFLLRPEFLVKHGGLLRSEAGASAKAEFTAAGISGISGHTHRLSVYRKAGYVQREWAEQGGLMRLDPDYVVGIPNWHQGIVVGEFSTKSPTFMLHEVPAKDGKLRLGLQSY